MTRLTKDEKYRIIKKHDFRILDTDGLTGIRYEISKVDDSDNITLARLEIVDGLSSDERDVYKAKITGTYKLKVKNLYIFQNKKGYYFSIKESIHPELSFVLEEDMNFCKKINTGFFKTSKDFSTPSGEMKVISSVYEDKTIPETKEDPLKKDCKCPLKTIRKTVWNSIKSLFKKGS